MAGVLDFLKSIGGSKETKAEAIATGLQVFTGERPNVRKARDDYGEYIEITPTERQADILRKQIESWVSKEPGPVRVNLSNIWTPLVIKKAAPWAIGLAALSAFAGRKSV
jgi:hypothetical protein